MYAAERQQEILELIRQEDWVGVQDLAERFSITRETARRDLTDLEKRGLVRRAHGGAQRVERVSFSSPVTDRGNLYSKEKIAIAQAAYATVTDNSTIAIDAGTSTIKLAELIPIDRKLTVVTYSLLVSSMLANHHDVQVMQLGGIIQSNSRSAVGPWTASEVERITIDAAFLSVDGVSTERGITTHNLGEATVKTAFMKAARRTVVLADHSKFGREEFGRIATLGEVDNIITDDVVDPAYVADIETQGPRVTVVNAR